MSRVSWPNDATVQERLQQFGAATQHPLQEERIMAKNQLVKDLMSQFFVPLLLTATGLGVLIFWPFSL